MDFLTPFPSKFKAVGTIFVTDTFLELKKKSRGTLSRQPGCLWLKTRGFPSPPHDGFGLDS
jgi:hypothetical protein